MKILPLDWPQADLVDLARATLLLPDVMAKSPGIANPKPRKAALRDKKAGVEYAYWAALLAEK